MVSAIVVCLLQEETTSAIIESIRNGDNNRLQNNERDDQYDNSKLAGEGESNNGKIQSVSDGRIRQSAVEDDTSDDDGKELGSRHNNSKKRPLRMEDADDMRKTKHPKKTPNFVIDLTGVPPQQPILRSRNRVGSSKYQGVSFHKARTKGVRQYQSMKNNDILVIMIMKKKLLLIMLVQNSSIRPCGRRNIQRRSKKRLIWPMFHRNHLF